MRNQGRNRRSRNHKDEDEGQLNTPRDEPHAKSSYSRHPHNSHFNESHRMSSSVQGRTLYDSGRERNAVPGRAVREDDWDMGGAPERYPYESYHHPEHDGYENSARRDGEGWVGSNEPRYSSRGSWPQSYHHGEPSASYQESSAWKSTSPKSKHYDSNSRYVKGYSPNPYQSRTPEPYTDHTPNPYLKSSDPYPPPPPPAFVSPSYGTTPNPYLSPTAYEERDSATSYGDNQYHRDYKHWRERDLRASPPDQRMDYGVVEKQRANQVFSRKDSRSSKGPKFQSDSGWSGRRKGKEWTEETAGRWEDVPVEPALPPSAPEDRSWEPADSWKSSNHQEPSSKNQRQQNPGRSQNKQNKPTRRGQSSGKQKREWRNENRNEEVNLNNWTRRDTSVSKKSAEKPQHSGSRRKHGRSPSRSRSRSPESIRSHRSSYRSRSSSPVAKRRRREFSSPMLRSPSPVGEVGTGRAHHRVGDRLSSRSRSPYQSTSQHRRRSPSTDRSSVRSRSPSPLENRRPVHRLPAANSAPQSSLVPTGGGGVGSGGKSKKSKKNGQKSKQPGKQQTVRYPEAELKPENVAMPPPPVPQGRHSRQPTPDWTPNPPSNGLPPVLAPLGLPEKPTKIIPGKQAGFKPIVQSSSALKMFFPGDEDEAEFASGSGRSHHSHSDSNVMENDLERQEPPDIISGSTVESGSTASWNKPTRESDGGWGGRLAQSKGFSQARGPRRPSQNGQQQYLPDPHAASRHPSWDHSVYPPASANEFVSVPSIVSTSVNGFVTAPAMGGFDASAPSSYPGPPIAREFEEPYHQSQPAFAPQSQVPIPPPTRRSPPQETPISQLSVSKPPSAPWTVPEPAMTSSKSDEPVASDRKELYAILNQVGEGTFGKVYKARNTVSNVFVALKRIRMESERDGFPVTAMREIKLLQSLKHANVVRLYEMMVSNSSVYMVFEYMDHDLTGILSQTQFKFSEAHLKSLCHQMLAGLAYLHHKGVIHRDIKGSNILLNNRGELKLADFGLARFYQKRRRMDYTNRVITLWYRPPELLFGATVYGAEVDMWSAGCIMLELFTKKPIFQGNDEIHQLHVIFKILGTPTSERWKALPNLPWYELIKPKEALPNRFRDYFHKWLSPAALDLAERLLTYDPDLRVTAQEAMEAPYFTQETPFAERPTGLSTLDGEWHELETKQERHRKRKKTENVPA